MIGQRTMETQFQSTLSMRRATQDGAHNVNKQRFQSTLSMRRATCFIGRMDGNNKISIHALHEESDGVLNFDKVAQQLISIHALHEESDEIVQHQEPKISDFNPRSP